MGISFDVGGAGLFGDWATVDGGRPLRFALSIQFVQVDHTAPLESRMNGFVVCRRDHRMATTEELALRSRDILDFRAECVVLLGPGGLTSGGQRRIQKILVGFAPMELMLKLSTLSAFMGWRAASTGTSDPRAKARELRARAL